MDDDNSECVKWNEELVEKKRHAGLSREELDKKLGELYTQREDYQKRLENPALDKPTILDHIREIDDEITKALQEYSFHNLESIATDSKRIKWLTIVLVFFTIILGIFAALDFLARIGVIR